MHKALQSLRQFCFPLYLMPSVEKVSHGQLTAHAVVVGLLTLIVYINMGPWGPQITGVTYTIKKLYRYTYAYNGIGKQNKKCKHKVLKVKKPKMNKNKTLNKALHESNDEY